MRRLGQRRLRKFAAIDRGDGRQGRDTASLGTKTVIGIVLRAAVLAVASAALLAVVPPARAASITRSDHLKLDVGYNAIGMNITPLWLAVDDGLLASYGIEAEDFYALSPSIIASLLSGEVRFGIVGEDAVIAADSSGADIEILTSGPDRMFFMIYARPEFHGMADLKGHRMGVTNFGTTTDFIARYFLKAAGLTPQRDTAIIPMTKQTNMLTGLVSGAIDAAVLGSNIFLNHAEELAHFTPLVDVSKSDLRFYTSALVARKSWVDAHRNDALNMVRGYVAGIAAAYNDKNAALAVIAKHTNTSSPAKLEQDYRVLIEGLARVPIPESGPIRVGFDWNERAKASIADPQRLYDASFVAELKRDGFIDSLYAHQQ